MPALVKNTYDKILSFPQNLGVKWNNFVIKCSIGIIYVASFDRIELSKSLEAKIQEQ